MKSSIVVIGGGLSGLAAAIRCARFRPNVLLLEQHSRPGGLNSYYYRQGRLIETGLHAITNFAPPELKSAPLNRLLRQLKLKRKTLSFLPQKGSSIQFQGVNELLFTNDINFLTKEIEWKFPEISHKFNELVEDIILFDPFTEKPFISARQYLESYFGKHIIVDMLFCPLMYYGSSVENDMDLSQFVIMFRSIFLEGMFRPRGNIKELLDILLNHFKVLGGSIRFNSRVSKIDINGPVAKGIELSSGESIESDYILSTIGIEETENLIKKSQNRKISQRLGFIENVLFFPRDEIDLDKLSKTIIFFNSKDRFSYKKPQSAVDLTSGVLCFPNNFSGRPSESLFEIRTTHLANYHEWEKYKDNSDLYICKKDEFRDASIAKVEEITGVSLPPATIKDSFTPMTIKRYTSKIDGAIYGSPYKIKDGNLGFDNLFLAGTDQGFLGIIGSMLSGVSIVNQHILPNI